MNRVSRCQIAEMIEDALMAGGFRGTTVPFVWSGRLFGSLFESRVPMESMTLRQERNVALGLLLLSPLVVVAIVLAAPFEALRSLKAARHNTRVEAVLRSGGASLGSANAAPGLDGRAVIDYRIESEGRAVFFGTALVAFSAEQRELLGFTVHRSVPPRGAVDGETVRSALAGRDPALTEIGHWQWTLRDPYELVERPARPW
jgi:hypothetical protein